jgi:hypothetical protein
LNSRDLWAKYVTDADYINKRSVMWPAEVMYAEAFKCYEAQAYLACCVCVRGAIEAALHQAKTRTYVGTGGSVAYIEYEKLKELKRWANQQGLLGSGLDLRVDTAIGHGDIGAHLAQRMDKAIQKGVPGPLSTGGNGPTQKEAWDNLVTCVELIGRVASQRWK